MQYLDLRDWACRSPPALRMDRYQEHGDLAQARHCNILPVHVGMMGRWDVICRAGKKSSEADK